MARQCEVTGKKRMVGHNVSHAKNRTKRTFLPNTRVLSFMSELLGRAFKLKVSSHGLRTINHKGGLDNYVLNSKPKNLTDETLAIKKALLKKNPALLDQKLVKKEKPVKRVSARAAKKAATK
ncbi:MAG: 50S ribosomal protein L28 [Alphaproteobacteria bacterium]|nr:50S ribosomal protein L28 [Alphaproteobacteria bacterium]